MRWSRYFLPTLREDPKDAEAVSHKLMVRAGLIRRLGAGAYSYLPFGFRALHKAITIVREEMTRTGAQEILLPALQPLELWKATGRDRLLGDVLIRFKDRTEKEVVLGPTHEEVVTDLLKEITSHKHLPVTVFQIQNKFRDEPRPRSGVIRSKEFLMKDAYSFDADLAGLNRSYQTMYDAYQRIFHRCGMNILACEADTGMMGGDVSHEFMAPSEHGEDRVMRCAACGYAANLETAKSDACRSCGQPLETVKTIEVGHVFKLGTKYSQAMGATFQDAAGTVQPMIMGCYGIGVNRIVAAAIEQHHDAQGIIWPVALAPFHIVVSVMEADQAEPLRVGMETHDALAGAGFEVLLDDREQSPGSKLKDADLIGIPVQIVIGKAWQKERRLEVAWRATKEKQLIEPSQLVATVQKLLDTASSLA